MNGFNIYSKRYIKNGSKMRDMNRAIKIFHRLRYASFVVRQMVELERQVYQWCITFSILVTRNRDSFYCSWINFWFNCILLMNLGLPFINHNILNISKLIIELWSSRNLCHKYLLADRSTGALYLKLKLIFNWSIKHASRFEKKKE